MMVPRLETVCPTCGTPNDGHAQVTKGERAMPGDGDISMCAYCGTLSRYVIDGEKVSLSIIPIEEFEELMKEPDIQRAIAIGRVMSQRLLNG